QLFLVVSGLAMQVILAAAAACFSLADRADWSGPMQAGDVWEALGVTEFIFLECVVWGTFWSLQTAKPVQAIFQTIATLIAIFVLSGFSLDWSRQSGGSPTHGIWGGAFDTWGWLRTTWTVGIVAASWALGGRWLNGRAFEWEAVFGRLFQRRVPKARTMSRERAEPWQRTWQRLRWLELQSLKSFGWMTVAATVLSCVSILFGTYATLGWMVSLGCLLILIAGLQSWRGEQARQQYRMFVNNGVSPAAVWGNKLLMWFTATLLAVAVVGLTTVACWTLLSSTEPDHINAGYVRRWPSLFTQFQNESTNNPTMLWMTTSLFVLYGLMMFSASFTWSLLSRKAVIAFGLALITLCILSPWYALVTQLGMPMWLFLAPLPVWLLWISWRHLTAWWLERTGWRVWLARSLELALVPAVLVLGAIAYRVYEIPWIPDNVAFPGPSHAPDKPIVVNNVAAWNRVVAALRALPDLEEPAQPMPGGMGGVGIVDEPIADVSSAAAPANGPPAAPLDEWIAANPQPLKELATAVLGTQGLMDPEAAIWNRALGNIRKTTLGVRALARQAVLMVPKTHERETQVPSDDGVAPKSETDTTSVAWLQAAARLGGAVRRYAPLMLPNNLHPTDDALFAEMIAWAQHPEQTAERLRHGLSVCSSELRLWRVYTEDVRAEADWQRQQKQDAAYWPWEEARRQRLLQIAAINRSSYVSQVQSGSYPASLYPDYRTAGGFRQTAWQVEPGEDWLNNTYWAARGVDPVVGLEAPTITLLHDAETRYRATITTMAVVGYRRLHGRLPVSLSEVAPLFDANSAQQQEIMHDPWSGGWFHYEPAGFPLPADSSEMLLKQPLLWSGGPNHYEVRATSDHKLYAWSTAPGRMGASVLSDRDLRGLYVFPIPPQTP
ncbi:MAG TPA: hypothetical protein VM165_06650, partial [Planctomycetaceae bacterium]|nr:hypothetical protein [Planctomycetaceae bacterium]